MKFDFFYKAFSDEQGIPSSTRVAMQEALFFSFILAVLAYCQMYFNPGVAMWQPIVTACLSLMFLVYSSGIKMFKDFLSEVISAVKNIFGKKAE